MSSLQSRCLEGVVRPLMPVHARTVREVKGVHRVVDEHLLARLRRVALAVPHLAPHRALREAHAGRVPLARRVLMRSQQHIVRRGERRVSLGLRTLGSRIGFRSLPARLGYMARSTPRQVSGGVRARMRMCTHARAHTRGCSVHGALYMQMLVLLLVRVLVLTPVGRGCGR